MSQLSIETTDVPLNVDVAIIGAGIGGLAAALALRKVGIQAHVYERTGQLGPVGGAVVIRKPVVRLLALWGVAGRFLAEAVPISLIESRDADGKPVGNIGFDQLGEGSAFSVHRSDLHSLLLSGLDPQHIHLGLECVEVIADGDRGLAQFQDGRQLRAKVLIGADGIKSIARKAIVQDELVFSKLVALRGLAPFSAMPVGTRPDRIYVWGIGQRIMIMLPLRSGAEVAMDTVMFQDTPPEHLWTSEVPTSELVNFFEGFDPAVIALIKAGTVPVRANAVFEREPIDRWSSGRITLLGDAAHPMAPRMGQGANQAILDGDAIARALAAIGLANVPDALRSYEMERAPITKKVQLASRTPPAIKPMAGSHIANVS